MWWLVRFPEGSWHDENSELTAVLSLLDDLKTQCKMEISLSRADRGVSTLLTSSTMPAASPPHAHPFCGRRVQRRQSADSCDGHCVLHRSALVLHCDLSFKSVQICMLHISTAAQSGAKVCTLITLFKSSRSL